MLTSTTPGAAKSLGNQLNFNKLLRINSGANSVAEFRLVAPSVNLLRLVW
jgi:hypothetical protein